MRHGARGGREAKVAAGGGVDAPPPPARRGWRWVDVYVAATQSQVTPGEPGHTLKSNTTRYNDKDV